MSNVVTFVNHAPIRISGDPVTVWDAGQDFGHHRVKGYTTQRGKTLYWASRNSGRQYGGRDPETTRVYLPTIKSIRDYFAEMDMLEVYHSEVESEVDPAAIIDVDAIA